MLCYNKAMTKKILKENWAYLLVIFIVILLFLMLFNSNYYNDLLTFDNNFFNSISGYRNNFLTSIFKVLTFFGDFYVPVIVLLFLLIFVKNKWIFGLQFSSYAFAGAITFIAKTLIARARPLSALISIPKSYSFPSGHTLTSVIFYIMLVYIFTYKCDKKIRLLLIVLTTLFSLCIAISRTYLGVHYFSDIFGGIILSIPTLLLLTNIIDKNFSNKL